MAAKSTSWANKLLKLVFNNDDATGIGDAGGLLGSTVDGNLYVSLHTATPGAGGDQTTNEVTYGAYARVAVARTTGGWTVTGATVVNAAAVIFPQATTGPQTATHAAIGTAASGAGVLLYFGAIPGDLIIALSDIPTLSAGSVTGTES